MAAAEGNNYSNKNNRLVADTLRRIAIQEDGKKLRAMCEAIYLKAADGDVSAATFIADRLDGKPTQVIAGDPTQPLTFQLMTPWLSQQIQQRNSA